MDKIVWLLIALALLGVFLLGKGITGLVVSQSCCFLPNCAQEDICDAARIESSDNTAVIAGSFLILIAVSYILVIKRFIP